MAYLLALYHKNPLEAGVQLETVCKTAMRTDFDVIEKMLFVPAHGLYQLAACLWDNGLFQQLPMPDHKSFSRAYAVWRNSREVQPALFITYPEPAVNAALISSDMGMDGKDEKP